jgi:RNA polymerase primary sigma factor
VLAVAKRYSSNDNIMDLVQVGNIGMIQAIDNYNPNKKGPEGKPIRFLSYAAWYIRREITFYIVNNGFIRKTNNVKTVYKLNRIKNNFYLHNGRYPSMDELKTIIEDEYGIKIKDYSYLYDIETKYIGATYDGADKKDTFENSALFNEKSASMNEYDDKIEYEYNKSLVDDMLKDLTKRERDIVKRLYGIGYDREFTMDEVSEMYGMTRERVRQIKNASVKKLKKLYVHESNK